MTDLVDLVFVQVAVVDRHGLVDLVPGLRPRVVVLKREQPAGSNRQHAVAGSDEYPTAQSANDDSMDPGAMRAAAYRQLCRAERPVAEAARCHGHAGSDSGREVMRVDYANDARVRGDDQCVAPDLLRDNDAAERAGSGRGRKRNGCRGDQGKHDLLHLGLSFGFRGRCGFL